jgi:hypothetical protein
LFTRITGNGELGAFFAHRPIAFFDLFEVAPDTSRAQIHRCIPQCLRPKRKFTNVRCTGVSSLPVRRLSAQALRSLDFSRGLRMEEWAFFVSPHRLFARRDASLTPAMRDIWRQNAFGGENVLVRGAFHLSHDPPNLRADCSLVTHCSHRSETSQEAALARGDTGTQPAPTASSTTPFTPGSRLQAENPELCVSAMTKRTA